MPEEGLIPPASHRHQGNLLASRRGRFRNVSSDTAPADGIKTRPTLQYLTAAQVGAMLQLAPSSVYRLAASDASMPALRLGSSIRFESQALARWLAARTQRPGGRRAEQAG